MTMFFVLLLIDIIIYPVLLFNILSNLLLWQQKEYRLDRMWVYLKYEKGLKHISIQLISKLFLLLVFIGTLSSQSKLINSLPLLYLGFKTRDLYQLVMRFLKTGRFKRPSFSQRNLIIIFFAFVTILVPTVLFIKEFIPVKSTIYNGTFPPLVYIDANYFLVIGLHLVIIMFFDFLIPVINFLLVLLTSPMSFIKTVYTIKKAKTKLNGLKNLKIIGISGSYGKTSTKEMLYRILKTKYKQTVVTPGNFNTTIGIAQTILSELTSKTKYFIAEMGAYRKGEIKKSVELCPLDFAIITNVGKSHLDIFGSIENIAKTKAELLDGIKDGGIAILNADNDFTLQMSKNTNKTTILFSIDESKSVESNVKISDIVWDENNVKFKIFYLGRTLTFSTSLVGKHQLQNLVSALSCALGIGFSLDELKKIVSEMDFESSHFKIYKGKKGSIIIDDGYNSNPVGFDAALTHLSDYKDKKKVIITKGIPEIGQQISDIYDVLAEKIIDNSDVLITSDESLFNKVKKTGNKIDSYFVTEENGFIEVISKQLSKETVILVEGRIHPDVKKYLESSEQ